MNHDEVLVEVMHLASEAILAKDPTVGYIALGDIKFLVDGYLKRRSFPAVAPAEIPSGADGTEPAAEAPRDNLEFGRMRMQVFGGPGLATKFIGKRTNDTPDNPVQIFEVEVLRATQALGNRVIAKENGELLFTMESQVRHDATRVMAIGALSALLNRRKKDNRRHRLAARRKKRATAAALKRPEPTAEELENA